MTADRKETHATVQSGAALVIAWAAYGDNIQRFRVIPVLVLGRIRVAVNATQGLRTRKNPLRHGRADLAASRLAFAGMFRCAKEAHLLRVSLGGANRFVAAPDACDLSIDRHGSDRFDFEPKETVKAARFCLEGASRQALDLELSGIWRKLAPLRDCASRDTEQFGEARRVLRVVDGILCSHGNDFSTLNEMSASTLKPLDALIDDMALKDRIAEAQGALTNAKFARALGVTAASVTQWRDGSTKSLKGDVATKMERVTGYRADWILNGRLPKRADNVEQGPRVRGTLPLLSDVQAGMYKEFVDNFHPGDGGAEAIPTTVQINKHTFALRVVGDSMEPLFPAGMILIVEPELEANPGDFVIARNGDDETTFKQLTKDGHDWYLKPLNERYPIKPLGESLIIGVVRAASLNFR